MKKVKFSSVILMITMLVFSFFGAGISSAEVSGDRDKQLSQLNSSSTYPGTTMAIVPGDVIYTPKSKSTYFVGHVAIVGTDGMIYHSYPNASGKRRDTPTSFFNLFDSGDQFRVLYPFILDQV